MRKKFAASCLVLVLALPAQAAELLMIEEPGCFWCARFKREIGPIYPKTGESDVAPLRFMNIDDARQSNLEFTIRLTYTPTFVLMDEGRELARLEGYPGEDFFWGLLGIMLDTHLGYKTDG